MNTTLRAATTALVVLLVPLLAIAGPVDEARKKLQAGQYADAATLLEKERAPEARALLGRTWLDLGRYEEAIALGDKLASHEKVGGEGAVIAARGEVALGRYDAAIARLRKEIKRRPDNYEARIVLAEARQVSGTPRRELTYADAIADDWNEGEVTGAEELTWLGRGLHLNEYFKDANEIFFEAREDDPAYLPAHVHHALLFLEKEDELQAGQALKQVLAQNPRHPLALSLMAYMDLSSDNDTIKARERLDEALKVNPRFVPARHEYARLYIEIEQLDEALKELEKAVEVNPKDPKTLALMASAWLLKEDDRKATAHIKRALKINPRYAEGYHLMATFAELQHRYEDAIALERKALKVDPGYAPAMVGLGVGLSRLGKDEEANEALQKAFELDSFNVKAFNMTAHFYDGPVKDMEWRKSGRFRLRLHKAEADALFGVMPGLLEAAFEAHRKKYGFTPKTPIHIEAYPKDETFAIRTVGYPALSAHAVCFGQVITTRSPSQGNFNWAMVMWHELAHVWHIQMSKSRVPRWFTEGLAEHETTLARPEWKREMDADLWAALEAGELKGIEEFNTMFVHAKTVQDIVVAYYYASKVVAFIDKTWGFDVFPKMLKAWGERKKTVQVFREVLDVSLEEFDERLKKYLRTDLLARYEDEFTAEGDSPEAEAFKRAEAAFQVKDYAAAAAALDEVLQAGRDGVTLRYLRALVALEIGNTEEAKKHLETAVGIDAQRSEVWAKLRTVYSELKDEAGEARALRNLARLEEGDVSLVMLAADKVGDSDPKLRLHLAEQAVHIAPLDPMARALHARALVEAGQAKAGLVEAEAALAIPGGQVAKPAQLAKARALIALGRKAEAKKLLEEIDDEEAKSLRESLK